MNPLILLTHRTALEHHGRKALRLTRIRNPNRDSTRKIIGFRVNMVHETTCAGWITDRLCAASRP